MSTGQCSRCTKSQIKSAIDWDEGVKTDIIRSVFTPSSHAVNKGWANQPVNNSASTI